MKIFHDKEILLNIDKEIFYDSRLLAIYEVSVASNILCRLGNPIVKQEVLIELDGYLEMKIKLMLETYLSETMNQRTTIRYNCTTWCVPVNIVCNTDYIKYLQSTEMRDECLLLYSNGLDSKLTYDLLNEKFVVHKVTWEENGIHPEDPCESLKVIPDDICNYTYIDTFDNDPWDDYGLYFIYLALLLNKAMIDGICNISIGLNKDDLFGYDIVSGIKIHSQCSQSKEFVCIFDEISNIYSISLLLPLKDLTRIDICKSILQRKINISDSISCVFFESIECGMCFSCFDKLTGFLVALAELKEVDNVDIMKYKDSYCLIHNKNLLMKFRNNSRFFQSLEKLPVDYIILMQLNRIIMCEDIEYIMSSKYSIQNILKLLYYYSRHKVGNVLFPRASELYNEYVDEYKKIFNSIMEK